MYCVQHRHYVVYNTVYSTDIIFYKAVNLLRTLLLNSNCSDMLLYCIVQYNIRPTR
jgi:hypothetical protein